MSVECELPDSFKDNRGEIQTLLNKHNGSVVVISTVSGVERANHYHKEDYHYCYVVSGSIIYFERPAGSNERPKNMCLKQVKCFTLLQ